MISVDITAQSMDQDTWCAELKQKQGHQQFAFVGQGASKARQAWARGGGDGMGGCNVSFTKFLFSSILQKGFWAQGIGFWLLHVACGMGSGHKGHSWYDQGGLGPLAWYVVSW